MSPRTPLSTLIEVENRICDEFAAMPRRTLTFEQLQQIVNADRSVCETVLEALVRTGILHLEADGAYRAGHAVVLAPESGRHVVEHAQ